MSASPRLFVRADLSADVFVALTGDQEKYLSRVLRLKGGDPVRAFNGRHGEWLCEIDEIIGKQVLLKAKRKLRDPAVVGDLWLLFAPLKKTRTDFVVEKASELGAAVIKPVMTERTQASRVNRDRLQATALEAAEQTERLDLPQVDDAMSLEQALSDWESRRVLIFA
ncbi:MAG: RsmE family RNA methyltransferase, partial [Pseudomonadota bacterium]